MWPFEKSQKREILPKNEFLESIKKGEKPCVLGVLGRAVVIKLVFRVFNRVHTVQTVDLILSGNIVI